MVEGGSVSLPLPGGDGEVTDKSVRSGRNLTDLTRPIGRQVLASGAGSSAGDKVTDRFRQVRAAGRPRSESVPSGDASLGLPRQVSLGDDSALEDEHLDPRERRLARLPKDAPSFTDLRDKPRRRRRMGG
jgi:hypothetical protein